MPRRVPFTSDLLLLSPSGILKHARPSEESQQTSEAGATGTGSSRDSNQCCEVLGSRNEGLSGKSDDRDRHAIGRTEGRDVSSLSVLVMSKCGLCSGDSCTYWMNCQLELSGVNYIDVVYYSFLALVAWWKGHTEVHFPRRKWTPFL